MFELVRARHVFDLVLDELEAGQPDVVEGYMIGASSDRGRKRGRSQVAEGFEPLAEQRAHGLIALEVDATNFSGPVVEVEVGGHAVIILPAREFRGGPWRNHGRG